MSAPTAILTIGVYGWTEHTFLRALDGANVDGLVDIRARRGVRGATHAFANRTRLEGLLRAAGIGYLHLPELAPSESIRAIQHAEDEATRTLKRDRSTLDSGFIRSYKEEVLGSRDVRAIAERLDGYARPALLCIERTPAACHRSLAARWIADQIGVNVTNLEP